MDIHLGTLKIVPALQNRNLLATKVAAALAVTKNSDQVGVAEIDPQLSDTAAFCQQCQVDMS